MFFAKCLTRFLFLTSCNRPDEKQCPPLPASTRQTYRSREIDSSMRQLINRKTNRRATVLKMPYKTSKNALCACVLMWIAQNEPNCFIVCQCYWNQPTRFNGTLDSDTENLAILAASRVGKVATHLDSTELDAKSSF